MATQVSKTSSYSNVPSNVSATHTPCLEDSLRVYRRGRWYDSSGKFMGAGDVKVNDILSWKKTLGPHEAIIVASEAVGWLEKNRCLPIRSLLPKASLVITNGRVYLVTVGAENLRSTIVKRGIEMSVLTPEAASHLVELR